MVDLIKKTDRQYKTKPRFHERRATDRGLCVWQLNTMLRGTGYKVERIGKIQSVVELLLVPTGYKKGPLINPFTGYWYVRLYPREKTLWYWQRTINQLMLTRVNKNWILKEFRTRMRPYYRTYNNKPDWPQITMRTNQLWSLHYGKAKHLQS